MTEEHGETTERMTVEAVNVCTCGLVFFDQDDYDTQSCRRRRKGFVRQSKKRSLTGVAKSAPRTPAQKKKKIAIFCD